MWPANVFRGSTGLWQRGRWSTYVHAGLQPALPKAAYRRMASHRGRAMGLMAHAEESRAMMTCSALEGAVALRWVCRRTPSGGTGLLAQVWLPSPAAWAGAWALNLGHQGWSRNSSIYQCAAVTAMRCVVGMGGCNPPAASRAPHCVVQLALSRTRSRRLHCIILAHAATCGHVSTPRLA